MITMPLTDWIILSLLGVSLLTGLVSWLGAVIYSFMAIRHQRKEIQIGLHPFAISLLRWNPFNLLFYPDLLTSQGLNARHKAAFCLIVFLSSVLSCFLIGWLASVAGLSR